MAPGPETRNDPRPADHRRQSVARPVDVSHVTHERARIYVVAGPASSLSPVVVPLFGPDWHRKLSNYVLVTKIDTNARYDKPSYRIATAEIRSRSSILRHVRRAQWSGCRSNYLCAQDVCTDFPTGALGGPAFHSVLRCVEACACPRRLSADRRGNRIDGLDPVRSTLQDRV